MSDPADLREALADAQDAFNGMGSEIPTPESGIDTDADWKIQLTKGCRLLSLSDAIAGDGYYTAVIELSFGAIERSLEAFAIAEGGDTLRDFQTSPHDHCYDRASKLGLLSRESSRELKKLYGENRTESYYGGKRPTDQQAKYTRELAEEIHHHAVNQIQEGGICNCDG